MFKEALDRWLTAADNFLKTVETLPYDLRKTSGVCGEWSCQQIVAHLAGWQREALKRYGDFKAGDTISITYDIDRFNAGSVEALKLLNWYEVLDTFRFTRDDLARAAQELSPDQILKNPMYEEWLVGIETDLIAHTQEIQQWLIAQKDG